MSISGALSNALSGMTAASRSANVSASNIANAMTDGYGVREVMLAPRAIGDEGGVQVLGIQRHSNDVLLAERRTAEASLGGTSTLQEFYSRLQITLGLPTEVGSLNDRLIQLEGALTEATLAPESEAMLLRISSGLSDIATHLNDLGSAVQAERTRADADIAMAVDDLNAALSQIEDVNASIRKHNVLGNDVSAFLDQRQALVDLVNQYIPVTEVDRGQGSVALMTASGTMLLEGRAAKIGFVESPVVTEHMSIDAGTLSALTVNGREVDVSRSPSPIEGGVLEALFRIRDVEAVEFQGRLDGVARDLIERFEDAAVDPSRPVSAPGLFTDNGTLFDAANEVGLAQRISVNSLVDPDRGGEMWRLRDGLGATSPGPEGQSAGLMRLSDALADNRPSVSPFLSGAASTATELATDLVSHIGVELEAVKASNAFYQAQFGTLKGMELAEGVDTDAEMQRLLLIEQAYAANARVVQVADEMLDWLMGI